MSWAESGSGFVIKDLETFSAQILPQYFKHKKYTSFVRQVLQFSCSSICTASTSNDTSSAIITTSLTNTSEEAITSPKPWIPSCSSQPSSASRKRRRRCPRDRNSKNSPRRIRVPKRLRVRRKDRSAWCWRRRSQEKTGRDLRS